MTNERRDRREAINLTQTAAAAQAGISLATWRRWEDDPDAVAPKTRNKCAAVLDKEAAAAEKRRDRARQVADKYEKTWGERWILTPRQAYALVCALHSWADMEIGPWLEDPTRTPLHTVGPFTQFDRRVMMYVNDNRAWAAKAQERCYEVGDEIESGTLPFTRPGCFFDELLFGAALREAEDLLRDLPDLFEEIAAHPSVAFDDDDIDESDPEMDMVCDEDWDLVSDLFDNDCRWDEWEIPLYKNSPLLPAILAHNHPYSWFDLKPPSGPGYLNRLVGLEGDPNNPQDKARMDAAAAKLSTLLGDAVVAGGAETPEDDPALVEMHEVAANVDKAFRQDRAGSEEHSD
ncbi:MAG: hypothetical protein WBA79_15595 [Mycobacterium sp.]